jgi:hypothetical protein
MKIRELFLVSSIALLIGGCIGAREITIDPEDLKTFMAEHQILAVHYLPWSLTVYQQSWYKESLDPHTMLIRYPVAVEDPISKVQDRFVAVLAKKLDMHDVRSIGEARPASEDQDSSLEKTFGNGMVFNFETRYWRLITTLYYPEDRFYLISPKGEWIKSYNLSYAVRGRLIRIRDSKLLWKALCNVDLPFQTTLDTYHPNQENQENKAVQLLVAEEDSVLKLKRDEAVVRCSNELLKKFLEK